MGERDPGLLVRFPLSPCPDANGISDSEQLDVLRLAAELTVTPGAPIGDSTLRDHAANERTLLAWIRTGIALMAFGFAISRFGLFLREIAQAGALHVTHVRAAGSAWFGVALVVLGLVTNVAAVARYAVIYKAIAERRPITPSPRLVYALGAGSIVVAITMAVVLADALRE
jgi:putative membrane protein